MTRQERRGRKPRRPSTRNERKPIQNNAAVKQKNKASEKEPVSRSVIFSALRGLFILGLLFVCGVFIATIYLRDEIQTALSRKITEASSVVLSRPVSITPGMKLKSINLSKRLQRLKYREVSNPLKAGEYQSSEGFIKIHMRSSRISNSVEQKEGLYEIKIDTDNSIKEIINKQFNTAESTIWLEPEVISVLGNSSQRVINNKALAEFSKNLKNALLAIEDEHFYSHFGIDPFSIIRAMIANLKSGRIVQGGSTLTQQLAKNLFFSSDRNMIRKVKEAFAAIMIESAYSKDQIFEMYLNEVFLGQEGRFAIHGFGEASQTFFGKEVSDISLSEAAMLAGMVKAPTSYSPRLNYKRSLARKNVVLGRMLQLKMISETEHDSAIKTNPHIYPPVRSRRVAPYFVDFIQREVDQLITNHQMEGGALRIITGLDPEYQRCAETAITEGVATLEKNYSWIRKSPEQVQAALLSVIPSSGEIRAWVGGRDFGETQFDRISQAKRQPGSTFKPFVYLTALDGSLNQYRTAKSTTILEDNPVKISIPGGTWEPKNYDKDYRGEVRLREALARSLNIPTVNLAQKVGIKNIARTGAYFGFGENLPQVPSLALGAGEVSPLELTYAFSIITNGGIKRTFRPFFDVFEAESSRHLYSSPVSERRIVDEEPVYILTDILRSAVDQGTGAVVRQLGVKGAIAGKTGTTNDSRDSWFVGYSPRILATVWVGFDSNKSLRLTGAQAAAPIWASYMKCIQDFEPQLEFFPPEGVVSRNLDKVSGLLMTESCPRENSVNELFVQGTEPVTLCPLHSSVGQEQIQDVQENSE